MSPIRWNGLAAVELVHAGTRLVVVHELGPRIAFFGRVRGENLFYWDEASARRRGDWRLHGGHRLWVTRPDADESEETYEPDERPCRLARHADGVRVTAPPGRNGIEKSMRVRARPGGFVIEHRLANRADMIWAGGAWALTCSRPRKRTSYGVPLGAPSTWDLFTMVIPRRWGGTHRSRVDDPQIELLADCVVARPRGEEHKRLLRARPGMLVMNDPDEDVAFVKRVPLVPGGAYPCGCNLALYLGEARFMVEMETMGPSAPLAPGASLVHVESWSLRRAVRWDRDAAALAAGA